MLIASGLKKSFEDSQPLFENFDLFAREGAITIIKGPNGTGKTTLLRCLAGLLTLDDGYIKLDEVEISPEHPNCRYSIGYALNDQHSFFPQLTLRKNLMFYGELFSQDPRRTKQHIDHLLISLGINQWSNESFQKCSTGIKKRASIARALLHQPKLLLLDEPFSNLDEKFQGELEQFIQNITIEMNLITILTTNRPTLLAGDIYELGSNQNNNPGEQHV